MESLVSFSKWLSKWFTVAVILWAAFNYALPATSSWVIPNTAYLLGLILFGMGLTLTTEDFKRIAKRPIPVYQRRVAQAVKRARQIALLPYVTDLMIEHLPYKQRVTGSSPVGPILLKDIN